MKYNDLYFGEGNIRSVQNDEYAYLTWNLPSQMTCPFSTFECRKRCFSKKNEVFEGVKDSRMKNYIISLTEILVNDVICLIKKYQKKKKCQNKKIIVRIHTSGDFYSQEYLDKWIEIANHFKGDDTIQFQSYTKSVIYLKDKDLKDINIHFVFSQWDDTKEEYVKLAKELDLPIFRATSRERVEKERKNNQYCCPKTNDGKCKECYKKNHKIIYVSYH